jgi:hypothetical protein
MIFVNDKMIAVDGNMTLSKKLKWTQIYFC